MQLFYNPEINESTTQFSFQKEESKHIVKVLRKSSGDIMHITNGRGWMFSAKIIIPSINKCTAQIISKEFQSKHSYNLHLAVAPTKMNDRYEWFLEKATEIGITEISLIECDNSERSKIKSDRLLKKAIKLDALSILSPGVILSYSNNRPLVLIYSSKSYGIKAIGLSKNRKSK